MNMCVKFLLDLASGLESIILMKVLLSRRIDKDFQNNYMAAISSIHVFYMSHVVWL